VDLTALAVTFGTIFLVELPDKTFIAALVLSTRYRPLLVWIGVGLAFFVQTLIAVLAGKAATLLPDTLISSVVIVIFLAGALILFRSAPGADAKQTQTEVEYAAKASAPKTGFKVIAASFLVLFAAVAASFLLLFAAEWGDLSQLLTINMVARYDDHVSVFLGAWGALLAVSGLAVLSGRWLLRQMRLSLLHYIGSAVCLGLACFTTYELLTST